MKKLLSTIGATIVAMLVIAKVSGAGTASAGLPGYTAGD